MFKTNKEVMDCFNVGIINNYKNTKELRKLVTTNWFNLSGILVKVNNNNIKTKDKINFIINVRT